MTGGKTRQYILGAGEPAPRRRKAGKGNATATGDATANLGYAPRLGQGLLWLWVMLLSGGGFFGGGYGMGSQGSALRRGRPLSVVSMAVLEKIASTRQATSAQLSTALQLNRRHAANVCSELAAAGHLRVVAKAGRSNVYATAASVNRAPGISWLFIGPAE
jgi:hypothetical protein